MRSQTAYGTPASAVNGMSTYDAGAALADVIFPAPRSRFDRATPSAAVPSAITVQSPCRAAAGKAEAWMTISAGAAGGGGGAGAGGVGVPTMVASFFREPGAVARYCRADSTI